MDLTCPHVRQVARITQYRTELATGKRTRKTASLSTDLPARQASPWVLGWYARFHWGMENTVHDVRDTTFGEDASRIRGGHDPQNNATLRPVAKNYLRQTGSSIADAMRHPALSGHKATLDLFGVPTDQQPC